MESTYKTDAKAIKLLMVECGFDTIVSLSKASGIDRNTLAKIIKGTDQPSTEAMYRIAHALNMEPSAAGAIFFAKDLPTA